ncbi:Nucleoside deoxyribosyltransferase [Bacillus licheniformis]|uniref:nucleoside 2-deoxyribosyltransferase n=1 Tax=Bacillus licheniformis TaxID=1402 RepID=UPI0011A41775|nr:YtoQ family protein [Bacillus licheniformis]TWM32280.1 Nucleoside deoxyribosyltransferase [Bacillus licheniformis]
MALAYIASPFFNDKEIDVVKKIEDILDDKGIYFFSPRQNQMDDLEAGTRFWSITTFINDVKFIDACDFVVAAYHGNYSDSGTAWELGYAYATQKPVILVHVGDDSNLMVHESAHANITLEDLEDYEFNLLPAYFYEGKMF